MFARDLTRIQFWRSQITLKTTIDVSASPIYLRRGGVVLRLFGQAVPLSLRCGAFSLGGLQQTFSRKQGPYKMIIANKNTLQIMRNGLENAVSIHQAALGQAPRRHCNDNTGKTKEGCRKEKFYRTTTPMRAMTVMAKLTSLMRLCNILALGLFFGMW